MSRRWTQGESTTVQVSVTFAAKRVETIALVRRATGASLREIGRMIRTGTPLYELHSRADEFEEAAGRLVGFVADLRGLGAKFAITVRTPGESMEVSEDYMKNMLSSWVMDDEQEHD